MKTPLLLLFSLVCVASQAQTKIIAHKSHSGNNADFNLAFENDLFDMEEDNLGMAPQRFEIKKEQKHPQLDSVIFVSETKAVIVTSNHCNMVDYYDENNKKTEIWKAGKETAINHPLFSKNHSLDSIKMILKTAYGFENPIDDVVFIGYDNKKEEKVVEAIADDLLTPEVKERKKRRHLGEGSVILVLGLTLGTLISGLFMLNRNN